MSIRVAILVLPWVLMIVSGTFLALGLSWRHLTDSDTVNGTFLVISIVFAALFFVCLCVREIPEREKAEKEVEEKEPPPPAQLPLVSVS